MRKLILLVLAGAAIAYLIRSRAESQPAWSAAEPAPTDYAPGPESAAEAPATEEVSPGPAENRAEKIAAGEADTVETEAVVPDTSADDPLVRQQEDAAAAEAADVGGPADTVTADSDPEMRPVVEGSGDAEETFEQTEEEGR